VPALEFIRQVVAIPDAEMRVHKVHTLWAAGDQHDWATLLRDLLERAHRGDAQDALATLEVVVRAAGLPTLAYGVRQQMYQRVATAAPMLGRIFFAGAPAATDPRLEKLLGVERPLEPRGRPLTLGERKSLARTHRRGVLTALCKDPHPDVVAIMLDNPHVTEPDVVRIASLRPAVPAALAVIAIHARWSLRPAVKRAVVWNPATPLDVAIRVATTLRTTDLRDVVDAPALVPPVRAHALELLTALRRLRPTVAPSIAPPLASSGPAAE
jgi:hypothetical protein